MDAGHFWAQLADDKSIKTHREFDITLNSLPGHSLKVRLIMQQTWLDMYVTGVLPNCQV